jgi:hypothetical protein
VGAQSLSVVPATLIPGLHFPCTAHSLPSRSFLAVRSFSLVICVPACVFVGFLAFFWTSPCQLSQSVSLRLWPHTLPCSLAGWALLPILLLPLTLVLPSLSSTLYASLTRLQATKSFSTSALFACAFDPFLET